MQWEGRWPDFTKHVPRDLAIPFLGISLTEILRHMHEDSRIRILLQLGRKQMSVSRDVLKSLKRTGSVVGG